MNLFLTSSASETIASGISAAFTLIAIIWIIGILILIGIVALITWVVKKVWNAGSDKEYKQYKKRQKEWNRAQKKYKVHKKNHEKEEQVNWAKWEAEQTKIPKERPKEFENNPDWKWDDKAQLWRHKSQWDKM